MKFLTNIVFLFYFFCPVLSQNNMNKKILFEFIVVNEDFKNILDISIEEFNKCKNTKKDYHFTISINDVEFQEYTDMKSLYISRSYYKDYLFVLRGEQLNDIFKMTSNTKTFSYKQEPIFNFDPSRWLYYYWNKEFYLADSSPCGG